MVFMGASLADGAWGRESAAYRVAGMFSVIGGWFFTALSAFTMNLAGLEVVSAGIGAGCFGCKTQFQKSLPFTHN